MIRRFLPLLIAFMLLSIVESPTLLADEIAPAFGPDDDDDGDGWNNSEDAYPDAASVQAAIDDLRARGASEYEENETLAWTLAALLWSDVDGDGWADQFAPALTDHCPNFPGPSYRVRQGCGDIDTDGLPDELDPDADGDGISNDMELAASTATRQYSIYDANSVPVDRDFDGIPDASVDMDDDNDGWDDGTEIERGSDPNDADSNPFNIYFGITTGTFYVAGEGFTDTPGDGAELSLSWILSALSTELIIPLGLIPIYLMLWGYRQRNYRRYDSLILDSSSLEELHLLEQEINELVRDRKIRTFQGLVLRNSIEIHEAELRACDPYRTADEEE
mgnify:CR=1 FL=1